MRTSTLAGSIVFLCWQAVGHVAQAQGLPLPEAHQGIGQEDSEPKGAATLRQIVTGRVCRPDGSPAEGAVVVTSAGGQAITGVSGDFTLVVDVPLWVESLEVTASADEATGPGSLVAKARLVPAALSPVASVGRLALASTPNCVPGWRPTFGGAPGMEGVVEALAVYDDGRGPALYAGGFFAAAGGVEAGHIVKWNGTKWAALGNGVNDRVEALVVHDDGTGPALYAGGDFTTAGGVQVNHVAKWDGVSWSALGSGTNAIGSAVEVAVELATHESGQPRP